jgi:hypothetical protein
LQICKKVANFCSPVQTTGNTPPRLKPMLKSLLIGTSISCAMAGISCFAVLMYDVDRSLVSNRPGLNSEQISLLALAALIAPAVGVIPLHAAGRLQD